MSDLACGETLNTITLLEQRLYRYVTRTNVPFSGPDLDQICNQIKEQYIHSFSITIEATGILRSAMPVVSVLPHAGLFFFMMVTFCRDDNGVVMVW